MTTDGARPDARDPGTWDALAVRLQQWRRDAGEPSFTEISSRISRRRQDAGLSAAASRVGRTTVYDAFRTGRTRVNLDLVREIGLALGVAAEEVESEIVRGRTASASAPAPPPVPDPVVDAEPATSAATAAATAPRWIAALLVGCTALNLLGREFVDLLGLTVYLDMVGTAIVALALGPWRGAAVGLATNLIGVLGSGPASLPFALVNVVGALVWGYGVRRGGLGRTLPRFFLLNVLVAAACSLVAVPILVLLFGGSTGHGEDSVTGAFLELTHALAVSVGLGNLLTSLADKVISGFVALVVVSVLPVGLRRALPLLLPVAAPGPAPGRR